MQRLKEARSLQTQQASQDGIAIECPLVNENTLCYKGCIYDMGSFYNDSLSSISVTGDAPARSK